MALDAKIKGSTSGNGAEVNAANQLMVSAETDVGANPGNVGAMRLFSENDPGDVTGTAHLMSPETSGDWRLRVGVDTLLFSDTFNGLTQNTNIWAYTFNTLTAASPGAGTVNFGVVQGTTSSHGAFMRTFQYFPMIGTADIWHEAKWGQFTAALVTNEVWSCGLGLPSAATTLPTDGVWFQLTTAGLIGRICTNGVFTDSGVLKAFGDFALSTIFKLSIGMGEKEVEWWCNDVLLGTTPRPVSVGQPMTQASLPAFAMKHNTGNVSNTNTMRLSDVTVSLADLLTGKPWSHQMASSGQGGYAGQTGQTQGKAQWWTNSTGPTAAAATNTAAIAGATTLGGLVAVLPTLAANNDGIFFTFTNPAATINITGRNFVCTGVKVQGAVSVILTGGPVTYAYSVAHGHTADSLATGETATFATATTHMPRQAFIGMETYPVTAAVGTIGQGCALDLSEGPIVVRPGERIALIGRNLGVVTTLGAITIGCTFIGYWE